MSFAKETARDTGKAVVIGMTPDVCLTPVGNSVVPVPYMVHATLSEAAANTASTVNMTDQAAYNTGSYITQTVGDAPGTKGGIKSGTVEDICTPSTHAPTVNVEGKPPVRNGDIFDMNNGNCPGDCIFIEDVGPNIVEPSEEGAKAQLVQSPAREAIRQVIQGLGGSGGYAGSPNDPIGLDIDLGLPTPGELNDYIDSGQMSSDLIEDLLNTPRLDPVLKLVLMRAITAVTARVTRRNNPCKHLAKPPPNGTGFNGGAHGDMQVGGDIESHHTPAKSVNPPQLSEWVAPAVQLDKQITFLRPVIPECQAPELTGRNKQGS